MLQPSRREFLRYSAATIGSAALTLTGADKLFAAQPTQNPCDTLTSSPLTGYIISDGLSLKINDKNVPLQKGAISFRLKPSIDWQKGEGQIKVVQADTNLAIDQISAPASIVAGTNETTNLVKGMVLTPNEKNALDQAAESLRKRIDICGAEFDNRTTPLSANTRTTNLFENPLQTGIQFANDMADVPFSIFSQITKNVVLDKNTGAINIFTKKM